MAPRTVVVAGQGGPSLTFTIPNNVDFDVQSVLAEVDASGAGDTIGELAIADASGVVIATKRQGEPIPAGDTGTETWALRLTDEAAAAPAGTALSFAVAIYGDSTDVPSGVTTKVTMANGLLLTNDPATFTFDPDAIAPFPIGVGVHTPGLYLLSWGVQLFDKAGHRIANPEAVLASAEESANGSTCIATGLLEGSTHNYGYHPLWNPAISEWDVSWQKAYVVESDTGTRPFLANVDQSSGETLSCQGPMLWVFKLSSDTFGI